MSDEGFTAKGRPPKRVIADLKARGVFLRATGQHIDTSSPAGKAFLDMPGVFAEFETNIRKKRQLEGIAKAKAAGVYKGWPATIERADIERLKAQGMGPPAIPIMLEAVSFRRLRKPAPAALRLQLSDDYEHALASWAGIAVRELPPLTRFLRGSEVRYIDRCSNASRSSRWCSNRGP